MADMISSIATAFTLATRLKEISKNLEGAEFKNLLADLSIELADAKLKMADLISENIELKQKIAEITSAVGETCPSCKNRSFKLISSKPHKTFGRLGVMERMYECSTCGFKEPRTIES